MNILIYYHNRTNQVIATQIKAKNRNSPCTPSCYWLSCLFLVSPCICVFSDHIVSSCHFEICISEVMWYVFFRLTVAIVAQTYLTICKIHVDHGTIWWLFTFTLLYYSIWVFHHNLFIHFILMDIWVASFLAFTNIFYDYFCVYVLIVLSLRFRLV